MTKMLFSSSCLSIRSLSARALVVFPFLYDIVELYCTVAMNECDVIMKDWEDIASFFFYLFSKGILCQSLCPESDGSISLCSPTFGSAGQATCE